ncbi:MAG: ABC transporter permease [Candidatus Omnitrophica bacterium]|nr:ABC transporter permease [Candidatus Omnitrophota bacterium]
MSGYFLRLIKARHILRSMVLKNLKDKYVGSTLGIFWAVINPLLIMSAVSFVFTQVMQTPIRRYPLLVLSAYLPWNFFVNSATESAACIRQNQGILSQYTIPREAIPVSVALADFLNFLFGFAAMLPIFIFMNRGAAGCLWLLPLVMALHLAFTVGISLLFSIINIYFRDFSQLLGVGMLFWFWVTPVFYTLEMMPAGLRGAFLANPATCYTVIYRELLYNGRCGGISMWVLAVIFALASLAGGYILFAAKEKDILKHI